MPESARPPSPLASGVGSARVTTAATSNSVATLRTALTFSGTALAEIAVTVQGMQMNQDADISPILRLDDYGAAGVSIIQNNTETVASFQLATGSANIFIPTNYQWRSGGKAGGRRT